MHVDVELGGLQDVVSVLASLVPRQRFARVLLLLALASAVAPRELALAAPEPRSTTHRLSPGDPEQHPSFGLTLSPPDGYQRIASALADPALVCAYVADEARAASSGELVRARLLVAWIDSIPSDADGTTSATAASSTGELASYVATRFAPLELGPPIEAERRGSFRVAEFALKPRTGAPSSRRGWACAFLGAERTIALIGTCGDTDLVPQISGWRKVAREIEIADPTPQSHAELSRLYAGRPWSDPALRIRLRKRLMPGWRAVDTAHYLIFHGAADRELVQRIAREIEVVRAEFVRHFPVPQGGVAVLRVCASEEEYLAQGGMQGTRGCWSPALGELVLDSIGSGDQGGRRNDLDTLGALFGEAFRQHVSTSIGDLAPHPWFDAGHEGYFAAAVVRNASLRPIGINFDRVKKIRTAVFKREHVPWKEFLRYDKTQFDADLELCSAQGWSIVYFLRTARVVLEHPAWARILPAYFEALARSWAEEVARARPLAGAANPTERSTAGVEARARAIDAAFRGVDLVELESAWCEFVRRL